MDVRFADPTSAPNASASGAADTQSIVVIGLGFIYRVSTLEWLALVLAMTIVMSLEAMNSALEFAVDLASPELHPIAGKAKDVASAAVLIAAIGACVVGAIVFLPKMVG